MHCLNFGPPTFQLNTLAQKRGESVVYKAINVPKRNQVKPMNYVSLIVGREQFIGEGRTIALAKTAAATEALKKLRALPFPEYADGKPKDLVSETMAKAGEGTPAITIVHLIARKKDQWVYFVVTQERDYLQKRSKFVAKCTVGEVTTEGEGFTAKDSKKMAAEKMLAEMKKLYSLPPPDSETADSESPKVKKQKLNKPITEMSRNPFKEADAQFGGGHDPFSRLDPVSRLFQIQKAKNERGPVFTAIGGNDGPSQGCIMQCTLGDLTTGGSGPDKKTAARNAAEAMLQRMAGSSPTASAAHASGQPDGARIFPPGGGNVGGSKQHGSLLGIHADGQNGTQRPAQVKEANDQSVECQSIRRQ